MNHLCLCMAVVCVLFPMWFCHAHDHTWPATKKRRERDNLVLVAQATTDARTKQRLGECELTLQLVDAKTKALLAGNVQITDLVSGQTLALTELIARPNQWFATSGRSVLKVPQSRYSLAAFQGLESAIATQQIDLRGKPVFTVKLPLQRFYDANTKKLVSGNTHVHLNRISREQSDRYLRIVPKADDLDIVYVSHLERAVDDEGYITNEYDPSSLAALSDEQLTLRYGEEHRHNFEPYGEGYGHVMFLDLQHLVQPVSLGPGITQKGTDGVPLRRGILEAHQQAATVIWCHNTFGLEDLPSWLAGVLHAQNIFDGGDHGSYDVSFYRYLNLGMRVPFSTGTDWSIYDLSRVFVPLPRTISSEAWLKQLAAGRSYITNGTFLEFSAADRSIGDTLTFAEPGMLKITGRGIGRTDFRGLELVYNGEVVHRSTSHRKGTEYESLLRTDLAVNQSGWVALRIPLECPNNEFGHRLFAHTSPIYVTISGQPAFDLDGAQQLLVEMEKNMRLIAMQAKFANDSEKDNVMQVHREAIEELRKRMQSAATKPDNQ